MKLNMNIHHDKEYNKHYNKFILTSRIIWLGDLNYRIALSHRTAKALVEMQNWRALLENDQAWKLLLAFES